MEKLASTQAERDTFFEQFTPAIRQALDRMDIQYEITSRVKSPYSIWRKIQDKKVSFEEIYDILAIRIVFQPQKPQEEINECFNIYVALTQIYKPHPDRTRDWVSHPKANGYQALHVTLMSNQGEWVEVQIRSQRMDDIDEQGLAAHWKYKNSNLQGEHAQNGDEADEKIDNWLHTIKEILDDPQPDTLDLLDTIKLNLFAKEIIVFTPKGDIKSLPAGATTLDFAFSIHTMLGTHCIGAKVNHTLKPLMYPLKGGDQVEILTSNHQQVKREWLNYVTTAKAKSKIQASLRKMDREKQHQGGKLLQEFLESKDIEYNSTNIDKLRQLHHMASRDDLLLSIGMGELVPGDADINCIKGRKGSMWRKFIPFIGSKTAEVRTHEDSDFVTHINRKEILPITDQNIPHCHIAECCHPIPGDDALGYIDESRQQLFIHKRNCETATQLKSKFGNNIIAVRWDLHKRLLFQARIAINGIDEDGMLLKIADVLQRRVGVNVSALNIAGKDGLFNAQLTVQVHDTEEINAICQSLKKIENVLKAVRYD